MYASTVKREEKAWLAGTPPPYPALSGAVPTLDQLMLVQDEYSLVGEGEKKRIEMCSWRLVHLLMQGTSSDPVSTE
ncbi:MAG TPA: hypothetical protein PLV92_28075, partial [Pirellulaceae bacterium]|nr:hypothetical protein [Pirellulaceae bacterium]